MARILILDDEVSILKLYTSEFVDEGCEVMTATSGIEALYLVREWEPDLLILDIRLGDESGLELLRHLREVRPSLAVILNSGYSGYMDDFSSWLADAYLLKSSDTRALRNKVREFLISSDRRPAPRSEGRPGACASAIRG